MESRWLNYCFRVLCTLVSCLVLTSVAAGCTDLSPRTILADPSPESPPATASPSPSITPTIQAPVTNTPLPALPPPTATSTLAPVTITPTPGIPSPTAVVTIQASATSTSLAPDCPSAHSRIENKQLYTANLPGPLIFRVYLPPCYTSRQEHRYPVLYMLHGLTYSDDQWVRLGIAETADALIAAGQIRPLIIVMPFDDDYRQPTESHFGLALVNDLIPWVDSHYASRSDRNGRAIGGLSRGASWAIHLGLQNWRLFGSIGSHSLALFWSDSIEVNRMLDAIPWDAYPRIYMDIGTKDEDLASAQDFEKVLTVRHVPHEWHLFPGYHDEAYWRSHVEDYLRWYSAQW